MARLEIDINKLTPEERLDLIEELWDSLSTHPAKIPLTGTQARELDRRVAGMEQDDSLASLGDSTRTNSCRPLMAAPPRLQQ